MVPTVGPGTNLPKIQKDIYKKGRKGEEMFLTGILAWSSNRKKTRASVSKGKPFITDISRAHFPESLQKNKHLPLLASEAAQGEERTGGQAQAARAGMRAIRKLPWAREDNVGKKGIQISLLGSLTLLTDQKEIKWVELDYILKISTQYNTAVKKGQEVGYYGSKARS